MSKIIKGPKSIDDGISKLLKPIFEGSKKEFLLINNLSKNWEDVVGKKYAKSCHPKSVLFSKDRSAKLTIAVDNPAVGFLLESTSEIILERIASLYGFKSITKIVIKQEPKQSSFKLKKEIKLSAAEENFLQQNLKKIDDSDLAATLEKIGKEILTEKNK